MGLVRAVRQWLAELLAKLAERSPRTIGRLLLSGLIGLLLVSCSSRSESVRLLELPDLPSVGEERRINSSMSEVAPPAIFSDLDELITETRPQVTIAVPKPDQIFSTTTFTPKINLRGLSIYKDEKLGLGPHLQVILDNQPAQSIYSLDEPIEFSDLAPGSHTLRVIAVKPWDESFKNEEAYAQTTFHIFAKTDDNTPNHNQPQLIYNAPQGTYGAQPVLLDFYLNNAPLHLLAASDPELTDWRIRCNVNGQSFVFDQWQPIYLKGFNLGQNWVQITLIDDQDNPIKNAFNSTVRVVNFDPEQRDTLAKMTRGELSLRDVGQVVVKNYEPLAEVIELPEPDTSEQIEREETAEFESQTEENAEPDALKESSKLKPEADSFEVVPFVPDNGPGNKASFEEEKKEPDFASKALIEDIPQTLETEDVEEAVEEAIAPAEEKEAAEEKTEDTKIVKPIEKEIFEKDIDSDDASESLTPELPIEDIENVEADEPVQTDKEIVENTPQDIKDESGFFTRIKTFWKTLEESQPVPISEPNVENTEAAEEVIKALPPLNPLPTDSPLLIPELQLSDLS